MVEATLFSRSMNRAPLKLNNAVQHPHGVCALFSRSMNRAPLKQRRAEGDAHATGRSFPGQ